MIPGRSASGIPASGLDISVWCGMGVSVDVGSGVGDGEGRGDAADGVIVASKGVGSGAKLHPICENRMIDNEMIRIVLKMLSAFLFRKVKNNRLLVNHTMSFIGNLTGKV